MLSYKKYDFDTVPQSMNNTVRLPVRNHAAGDRKKQFKRELVDLFRKFGYLLGELDHEVTFRTTSGNIAWVNIKKIEIIK